MIVDPSSISRFLAQSQADRFITPPPLPGLKDMANQPAAVLIPLLKDKHTWKILFIKRTEKQEDPHSGQIAFPGGRFDNNDSTLERTALREAYEEIGLAPGSVQILGQSCSMITVTGYEVTPFAGILDWPLILKLSREEVEKTFLIPLDWLADPANYRTELWASRRNPGIELPVIFFKEYEGEVLWGVTAQILVDFLAVSALVPGD
jgi:8-oxo-dGTP pyrophosphatase MutT (NUDIX family)